MENTCAGIESKGLGINAMKDYCLFNTTNKTLGIKAKLVAIDAHLFNIFFGPYKITDFYFSYQ